MRESLNALALRTLAASALLPAVANACSMVPITIQRFTSNTVNFIGTALADTVQTGPGDIKYEVAGGHFGPARDRVIFGQRVSVEQLSAAERRLLPGNTREMILVPWDYDAACQPTPWSRSARWIPSGTRGIYNARLRAPSHWVRGVPTLDVMAPGGIPYTGHVASTRTNGAPLLSIEELFSIAQLVPDPDSQRIDAERATRPLREWAQQRPELAEREPAKTVVRNAVYTLSTAQMKRVIPSITGTWRFAADVEGDATRVFYGRTHERSTSTWPSSVPAQSDTARERPVWELPSLDGYYVLTAVNRDIAKLPTGCGNIGGHSYMAERPLDTSARNPTRRIEGDLDLNLLSAAFAGNVSFKKARLTPEQRRAEPATALIQARLPVYYEFGTDGVLRVAQSFLLDDGRTLTLRAERVSREMARCEW